MPCLGMARVFMLLKRFPLQCCHSVLLLTLLLIASPVTAITPCNPDPCAVEVSLQCDQNSDWIAEGVITELRYRSFDKFAGLPQISGMARQYEARPYALVFLADNIIKGAPLPEEPVIFFETCLRPLPDLAQMRPRRMTIRLRKAGSSLILVHFKAIEPPHKDSTGHNNRER